MDRSHLYNVIHLGFSLLLVFISYIVAQTFQTSSDYAKNGAFAVGIIYAVFCLSNLALSSYITRFLGAKLTLILSSLTYVLFVAANIRYQTWLLFTSAFLVGLGAAFLWTAQGTYVVVAIYKYERVNNFEPASAQGFINGVFFGIFQTHLMLGNLIASYLFRLNYPQWIIFTALTIIAGIGAFSLIFLRPIKIPEDTKQRSVLASLSMLTEIPFLLLIPTMCYLGLAQGFIFATVPPLIIDKSQKFLIFALYGFINACSSVIFGKLSDYLGRRLLIFAIGIIAHMIIFGLFLTVWTPPLDANRVDIFIVMVICLSVGDAIFNTQVYSVLATFYGATRPAEAIACMKVFQAGSSAIAFVEQVYFPFSLQIICLIITSSLSFITLICEHYCVRSLDTGKMIMNVQNQNETDMETEIKVEIPLTTSSDTI